MALPNLATVADLQDRSIDTTNTTLVETMLKVASAIVRSAAESPIAQATSTVALTAWGDTLLDLPGQPVTNVASASIDGSTVGDYKLASGRLWRRGGWGCESEPSEVVVTLTHGFPEAPADIVDLVCNLASAGSAAAVSGDTFDPRVVMERIDDYTVQFAQGAEAVSTVMDLSDAARRRLRIRFGGGASVIEYR